MVALYVCFLAKQVLAGMELHSEIDLQILSRQKEHND